MIQIEKSVFPGAGDTLIFFKHEGDLKKDGYFTQLGSRLNDKLHKAAATHDFTGKTDEQFSIEGGDLYEHIIVYGIGKKGKVEPATFREYLASALRSASALKAISVRFFYPQSLGVDYQAAGREIALGFYLSQHHFSKYKHKKEKKNLHLIRDLHILFEQNIPDVITKGVEEGSVMAKGVMLARDLTNEPASHVYPESLANEAKRIAAQSKGAITVEVLNRKQCQALGMGSFLGVAEGSERDPQFIILRYTPENWTGKSKKICFIGKSITFDSGGLSLKPSKAMEDMKIDMAGGAAVLGVFQALSEGIKTPHEVVGILPACENMPSGKAMRPGDIVTAMNGKTAEVMNTDAEGRLTLADAVAYAEAKIKPDLIIDFATLTGACMVALGDDIAGVFGNDEHEVRRFLDAAKKENEAAWELPYYKPYAALLKSDVADIKNVSGTGMAGAITGALFIGEFIEKTKWVHVDIAGPANNGGKIHGTYGRGGTGWGVISIISLLQQA